MPASSRNHEINQVFPYSVIRNYYNSTGIKFKAGWKQYREGPSLEKIDKLLNSVKSKSVIHHCELAKGTAF